MGEIAQIGLRAITESINRLTSDAERVARAFTPDSTEDAVSGMIDLTRDGLGVRAGAAIVRAGSDLYSYTLDLIA